MNNVVFKRAIIFALILGAFLGLISVIPTLAGFGFVLLSFFSSIIVLTFMKKNDKYIGIVDYEQGAILGGVIGFFCGIGFFLSFCPMVMIVSLIFKKYYTYGIPYVIQEALWLFFVIIIMVSLMLGLLNAVGAMGMTYVFNKVEKKPENFDARLDIKIDD